jgi:AcrR family transcriptional regulator
MPAPNAPSPSCPEVWQSPARPHDTLDPVTATSAKGTRLNKRGRETRELLLKVAVRCLAAGGPESVSANLIAREAGVTWGTVQHQFGDSDGLWAAVLGSIAERGTELVPVTAESASLHERIRVIVETIWNALDRPSLLAMHNLRMALPRDRAGLEADYPLTAAALMDWETRWERACSAALHGMLVDEVKLRRVRNLLPGAVRGLHDERHLSSFIDLDDARAGLVDAITAYLSQDAG